MGRAETPITSRTTPPTPVFAPPKGSSAEGWLCVSTLKETSCTPVVLDDPGVVDERRAHPGRRNLVGRGLEVGADQAIDRLPARLPVHRLGIVDGALEGLVHAVLRPGLRQALELHVGGLAALAGKIVLDGAHLDEVQRQEPVARERQEPLLPEGAEGHLAGGEVRGGRGISDVRRQGADLIVLDDVVGQEPAGDGVHVPFAQVAVQEVGLCRGGRLEARHPQKPGACYEVRGDTIRHAGEVADLDAHSPLRGGRRGPRPAPLGAVHDGVRQEFADEGLQVALGQVAGEKVQIVPLDPLDALDPSGDIADR